ncbi:hypothetical protein Bhyg_06681, partial [Pseudolycoriella hygida]
EYILIYLVLKYRKQLDSTAYKYAGAYFFALSMFLTKIIPTFVLAMLVMITLPTPSPSRFKEHFFAANISDVTYKYKILRMKDTIYVYVGEGDNEL